VGGGGGPAGGGPPPRFTTSGDYLTPNFVQRLAYEPVHTVFFGV
jgi:hypothetical protein